jgi:hypothetical protein
VAINERQLVRRVPRFDLRQRERQLFARSLKKDAEVGTAPELASMVRGGKSKTNAVCAIARKLVPMLLKVMQTAEPFDAAVWLADRRRPEAA